MTFSSLTNRNNYAGNGTTNVYAYSFKVFDEDHLLVTVVNDSSGVETTLTKTTHYTVSDVGESSGGNVTLVAGSFDWLDGSNYLDTGYSLTIRRVLPLTQETDIKNQASYFPEDIEKAFDLVVMIQQQQQDDIDRSVKLAETSTLSDLEIPDIQANKALYGDSAGTGLEFRTVTATETSYSGDISVGVDASKAASPSTGDIYVATDTLTLYICYSSGTWTATSYSSGTDASKAASPAEGAMHLATDTGKLYFCLSAGTWVNKFVGIFNGLQGSDIASASSIDLGAATGNYVEITGTTTITALGTADAGIKRTVRFTGALTLTHNGTSLILPGSANITTAANDTAEFISLGSGNWICTNYKRATGKSLAPGLPEGHINGFLISNNSSDSDHDIDIATGKCRDSSDSVDLALSSAITKRIDATWSTGTGNGGRSSSVSLSNTTPYYMFIIRVAGTDDVGFDTDIDASNLISDHSATHYRRIGVVMTNGSANIVQFLQNGNSRERDYFIEGSDALDTTVTTTTYTDIDLSNYVPPNTIVKLICKFDGTAGQWYLRTNGFGSDMYYTDDLGSTIVYSAEINILVDSSSIIEYKHDSGTNRNIKMTVYGFKESL